MEYIDHPDLDPGEKEFSLTTDKGRETVTVHSDIGTITEYLCEHPAIEIVAREGDESTTWSVQAEMPRGLLGLKPRVPATNYFSTVVTDAELGE